MSNSMRRFRKHISVFALLVAGPALLTLAAQTSGTTSAAVPAANPPKAAPEPSTLPAIQALRPTLDNLSAVIAGLTIARWKGAPGDVRSSTQQDVNSIQRDLSSTLPPLLDQAQAPGALAPSFAVYRNIDALYDVLLRVSEMASMFGSAEDAGHLEDARAALEASRGQLGNALLQSVAAQDTRVVQLREAVAAQARSKPVEAAPTQVIVDDGPAAKPKPKRKKAPAPAATTTPAAPK